MFAWTVEYGIWKGLHMPSEKEILRETPHGRSKMKIALGK